VTDLISTLALQKPLCETEVIVPVPLHIDRFRNRGFNQAVILGRVLAKTTGKEFLVEALVRAKHSDRHRGGMDALARQKSVSGVFEVRKPRLIVGKSVLLVDDVLTTGSTASECASVLKSAGANSVCVLTLARPEQIAKVGID